MEYNGEIEGSVFNFRKKLHEHIIAGALGNVVIQQLLPQGEPLLYEKSLWDYKLKLPMPPTLLSDKAGLAQYNAGMAEIVKDSVAFYNSYGGYILAGVRDKPRQVEGFSFQFDVDDLNKRIKGATGHDIDCHYALVKSNIDGKKFTFGLLFVPQRPDTLLPAQFKKDAPENPQGKRAYNKSDYFLRQGDECRPSRDPDDFSFLCTHGRRSFNIVFRVNSNCKCTT
jgi:predicted HTH transcriptional regulator